MENPSTFTLGKLFGNLPLLFGLLLSSALAGPATKTGSFAYVLQGAAPLTVVWAPPTAESNLPSFCTCSLCHLACLFTLMLAFHAVLLCLPCPLRLSDPRSYASSCKAGYCRKPFLLFSSFSLVFLVLPGGFSFFIQQMTVSALMT